MNLFNKETCLSLGSKSAFSLVVFRAWILNVLSQFKSNMIFFNVTHQFISLPGSGTQPDAKGWLQQILPETQITSCTLNSAMNNANISVLAIFKSDWAYFIVWKAFSRVFKEDLFYLFQIKFSRFLFFHIPSTVWCYT